MSLYPWTKDLGNNVNVIRDRNVLFQYLFLNRKLSVNADRQSAPFTS